MLYSQRYSCKKIFLHILKYSNFLILKWNLNSLYSKERSRFLHTFILNLITTIYLIQFLLFKVVGSRRWNCKAYVKYQIIIIFTSFTNVISIVFFNFNHNKFPKVFISTFFKVKLSLIIMGTQLNLETKLTG